MPMGCSGKMGFPMGRAVVIAAFLLLLVHRDCARAVEPFVQQRLAATQQNSLLDRTILDSEAMMSIEFEPWPRKITVICRTAGVPCGLEESPEDPVHGIDNSYGHQERLGLPDAKMTVRQVLDAVLGKHPHYRWEFVDGVLLVTPKPGKEYRRFWKPVLSRRLRQFKYSDTPAGSLLFQACLDAGVMKALDPRKMPAVQLLKPLPPTGRISVNLENVSVREAMAAVARADGQMGWKFAYDPSEKAYALRIMTWGRDSVLSPYWW